MARYEGDIEGNLTIYAGDDVSGLTSVGGYLSVWAEAQFPVLATSCSDRKASKLFFLTSDQARTELHKVLSEAGLSPLATA